MMGSGSAKSRRRPHWGSALTTDLCPGEWTDAREVRAETQSIGDTPSSHRPLRHTGDDVPSDTKNPIPMHISAGNPSAFDVSLVQLHSVRTVSPFLTIIGASRSQ